MSTSAPINKKENIKNKYKGLSIYSPDDYKKIWDDSIIVLDTNILLNLYRYSSKTRENILNVLEKFKDRIWIPYQVIREYYRNRDKVIDESLNYAHTLEDTINKKFDEMFKEVKTNSQKLEFIDEISKTINDSKKNINKIFEESLNDKKNKDRLRENIQIEKKIYELIGEKFEEELQYKDIEDLIKEGDRRIKNQIPPGYKDSEKDEVYNDYQINGDYLVFDSFVRYANENKKNVIFITDDAKEDWMQIINGKKQGGRKELLQEFYQNTGKMLLIYSQEGFISKYNEQNPEESVSEETVKEIEDVNNKMFSIHISKNNSYDPMQDFYSNVIELTDSEKRVCLKIIDNELNKQMQKLKHDENVDINDIGTDILENIKKIDKYYIKKYVKHYSAIKRMKRMVNQSIDNNDIFRLMLCTAEIILLLNKIIKQVD